MGIHPSCEACTTPCPLKIFENNQPETSTKDLRQRHRYSEVLQMTFTLEVPVRSCLIDPRSKSRLHHSQKCSKSLCHLQGKLQVV